MNMRKLGSVLGLALAAAATASTAQASLCQVLTTGFYETKYCGLTSRGYGKGQTQLGQKTLEAYMGGDGAYQVAATGVNSGGGIINTCQPIDTNWDGYGTYVVGGGCANAVKFYVSVYYY